MLDSRGLRGRRPPPGEGGVGAAPFCLGRAKALEGLLEASHPVCQNTQAVGTFLLHQYCGILKGPSSWLIKESHLSTGSFHQACALSGEGAVTSLGCWGREWLSPGDG